jgi:hypothetical protein
MILKFLLTILVFSILISAIASEAPHSHDHHSNNEEAEFEEHSAHEHGHASAQITLIDNILRLGLSFPSIDIYGFEHNPHNEAEHDVVLQSKSTLMDTEKVVIIHADKSCELKNFTFESSIFDSINEEHAKHSKHESAEHHDEEPHNNHHDEEHHDHTTHHDEEHSDVSINYEYNCLSEDLQTIDFKVFDHFPTIEEIEVQFISDDNQKLYTVTPKAQSFSLK